MRFLFVLIIFYAVIIVYGGVASAQEAEDPIAVQTSAWSIAGLSGTQEVGLNPENCLMQTQYNNGMQITFKATGKKLTALRVQSMDGSMNLDDFVGFVGLGVGKNSYALQSKTVDGRIDATLLTVPNLAEKLKDATVFRLKLGTQNTYFALQGFDDAYHRLLVCMGVAPTKTLKVVDHAKGMPRAPVIKMEGEDDMTMPSNPVPLVEMAELDDTAVADNDEETFVEVTEEPVVEDIPDMPQSITPLPAEDESFVTADASSVEESSDAIAGMPEWRAQKGQKLSSVLVAWSEQQGVQTHIAMDRDPVLSKDIVSNGSFEMAVNSLLREVGMGNGASAIIKNNNGKVTHVAGYQGGALIGKPEASGSMPKRWRALEGSDVRKVLMQWSAEQGVDFIWNAPEIYLVRQSLKTTADYQEAVATLLNQFKGQPTRPVAQLNKDPDTGRLSLVIETNRAG